MPLRATPSSPGHGTCRRSAPERPAVVPDALAVASVAHDPGAAVPALGRLGTRQGASAPRRRTRPSTAPPRRWRSAAGPCGDWRARALTNQGDEGWGGAPALRPPNIGGPSHHRPPSGRAPGGGPGGPATVCTPPSPEAGPGPAPRGTGLRRAPSPGGHAPSRPLPHLSMDTPVFTVGWCRWFGGLSLVQGCFKLLLSLLKPLESLLEIGYLLFDPAQFCLVLDSEQVVLAKFLSDVLLKLTS